MELSQQIFNGLVVGSAYALVAVGFALTFSVLGVLNLAHAALYTVAIYGYYAAAHDGGLAPPLAVVVGLVAVAAASAVLQLLVIRPLRGHDPLAVFVATASLAIAAVAALERHFGANDLRLPPLISGGRVTIGPISASRAAIGTLVVLVLATALVAWLVSRTYWGLKTRAIAENAEVSGAFGLGIETVSLSVIALSAVLAGIAGIMINNMYGSVSPFVGQGIGVKAFVIALVAGNRSITGVAVVGLALGVAESLIVAGGLSSWADAVAFAILLPILYFRPKGVFGSYA